MTIARRTLSFSIAGFVGLLVARAVKAQSPARSASQGTAQGAAPGGAVWVVTQEEAALPASPRSSGSRSISRGPAIRQLSPVGVVRQNTPFELHVEFAGRGGEKINPSSVSVTLLRGNAIDITSRFKIWTTAQGITIPNAMMGVGLHVLEIAVSDVDGHRSTADIEINVL